MTDKTNTAKNIKTAVRRERQVNDKELGSLWSKESQSGQDYFTGDVTINGVKEPVIVFRNNFKKHDRMPDWRIYRREPLNNQVVTEEVEAPN